MSRMIVLTEPRIPSDKRTVVPFQGSKANPDESRKPPKAFSKIPKPDRIKVK